MNTILKHMEVAKLIYIIFKDLKIIDMQGK